MTYLNRPNFGFLKIFWFFFLEAIYWNASLIFDNIHSSAKATDEVYIPGSPEYMTEAATKVERSPWIQFKLDKVYWIVGMKIWTRIHSRGEMLYSTSMLPTKLGLTNSYKTLIKEE